MALTEKESETLAAACLNVMQHYNIKASQKTIDWGNLLMAAGLTYGGKMMAINARLKNEKAAKRAGAESTSFFAPVNNGAGAHA